MSLRVHDAEGLPLGGARVSWLAGPDELATQTTDGSGRCLISSTLRAGQRNLIRVEREGFAPRQVPLGPTPESPPQQVRPKEFDVEMRRSGRVTVEARDEVLKKPLPRHAVRFEYLGAGGEGGGAESRPAGVVTSVVRLTDSKGRIQNLDLEPGTWHISTPEWRDCESEHLENVQVTEVEVQRLVIRPRRLPLSGFVSGRIEGIQDSATDGIVETYGLRLLNGQGTVPIYADGDFFVWGRLTGGRDVRTAVVRYPGEAMSKPFLLKLGDHDLEIRPEW